MSRRGLVLAGVVLVGLLALPLALYGSLRPCEILRQDLRAAFRGVAAKMTGRPSPDSLDQAARKLGAALATAIADPAIDQLVAHRGGFAIRRGRDRAEAGSEHTRRASSTRLRVSQAVATRSGDSALRSRDGRDRLGRDRDVVADRATVG